MSGTINEYQIGRFVSFVTGIDVTKLTLKINLFNLNI